MIMLFMLFAALIFASVADFMDDRITQRGIDAKIGVEANSYIDKLFGTTKPTFRQRLLVNFTIIIGIAAAGLFVPVVLQPAAVIMLVIVGVKHLKGYFDWKKFGAK